MPGLFVRTSERTVSPYFVQSSHTAATKASPSAFLEIKQNPTFAGLLGLFALASISARLVVGWWMWEREPRKNRDAYAAAHADHRAEFIKAIQEVSYWLDDSTTTKAEGPISWEIMTVAHWLARKRVKEEIRKKGFTNQVTVGEIQGAARALVTAQPQMVEQARARLEEMKKMRSPRTR